MCSFIVEVGGFLWGGVGWDEMGWEREREIRGSSELWCSVVCLYICMYTFRCMFSGTFSRSQPRTNYSSCYEIANL